MRLVGGSGSQHGVQCRGAATACAAAALSVCACCTTLAADSLSAHVMPARRIYPLSALAHLPQLQHFKMQDCGVARHLCCQSCSSWRAKASGNKLECTGHYCSQHAVLPRLHCRAVCAAWSGLQQLTHLQIELAQDISLACNLWQRHARLRSVGKLQQPQPVHSGVSHYAIQFHFSSPLLQPTSPADALHGDTKGPSTGAATPRNGRQQNEDAACAAH